MNADANGLTQGEVSKTLTTMARHALLGLVSVLSLNLFETYLASGLGASALASMSFSLPVITLGNAAVTALALSAVAIGAPLLGEKRSGAFSRFAVSAVLLGVSFGALAAAFGSLLIGPGLRVLGGQAEDLPDYAPYLTLWFVGLIPQAALGLSTAFIRAHGDSRTSFRIQVASVFINALLDPILMFGWSFIPGLGLPGAALAGIGARCGVLLPVAYLMIARGYIRRSEMPGLEGITAAWKRILANALPILATNLHFPLATAAIVHALAQSGQANAVAAFALGTRWEALAMMVPVAICTALAPFVGVNRGAGLQGRIERGAAFAQKAVLVWGLFAWCLFALGGKALAAAFSVNAEVAEAAAIFLLIVPAGLPMQGLASVAIAIANASGKSRHAMLFASARLGVLAALVHLGALFGGTNGTWIGIAATQLAFGAVAHAWLRRLLSHPDPNSDPKEEY